LTVTPAADVPREVGRRKQKLVIGNLQKTPLYTMATVNIHAFSDTIMKGLMERLGIPIPAWIVRRRVRVTREKTSDENNYKILVEGRDPDDASIPFTLFKSIEVLSGDAKIKHIKAEPFVFQISRKNTEPINIKLEFFGHYNEIPFNLTYTTVKDIPKHGEFYLFYNPMIGQWRKTTEADDYPL
jgi:mono-ADP-ribosyltransferase sirtuin 6